MFNSGNMDVGTIPAINTIKYHLNQIGGIIPYFGARQLHGIF